MLKRNGSIEPETDIKTPLKDVIQPQSKYRQRKSPEVKSSAVEAKSDGVQKIRSIKPIEKEADDPIEPPSPRAQEAICVHC